MSEPDDKGLDPSTEAGKSIDANQTVCGNCLFWRPTQQDDRNRWIGPCRVMPDRGDIPATSAVCNRFSRKGTPIPQAMPPERRRRRSKVVARSGSVLRRARHSTDSSVQDNQNGDHALLNQQQERPFLLDPKREVLDMTQEDLLEVLEEFFGTGPIPQMGRRWEDGSLLIKPADESNQTKEIPIEVFFKKLVRVRDQIRLLEQKINGHSSLTGSEKLELQAYLTRCYGSMTTFNFLFADAGDRFVGDKGS